MRLITFQPQGDGVFAGWTDGIWAISFERACRALGLPAPGQTMQELITRDLSTLERVRTSLGDQRPTTVAFRLDEVRLLAPLPRPATIRDFYAFEAHVKNARARRGLDMVPEWYQFPVFYFTNPGAVYGHGDAIARPRETRMLDFELEVAAVIGRTGRDILAEEAGRYIAGYMIMNDWSARDIQAAEMKVGLGPAKGKDFATSLGPWLATPDELEDRLTEAGDRHHLAMVARINGKEVSRGNLADLHFTFGQMIERASRDCTLCPGDVIGSGTVGTGCLLETGAHPWLEPGDQVELEVERLGTLANTVA